MSNSSHISTKTNTIRHVVEIVIKHIVIKQKLIYPFSKSSNNKRVTVAPEFKKINKINLNKPHISSSSLKFNYTKDLKDPSTERVWTCFFRAPRLLTSSNGINEAQQGVLSDFVKDWNRLIRDGIQLRTMTYIYIYIIYIYIEILSL